MNITVGRHGYYIHIHTQRKANADIHSDKQFWAETQINKQEHIDVQADTPKYTCTPVNNIDVVPGTET